MTAEEINDFFQLQKLSEIPAEKLPSKLDVLKTLFFYNQSRDLQSSLTTTIQKVILIWKDVQIPTKPHAHCKKKLETLYNYWRSAQKNMLKIDFSSFKSEMECIFDIAHGNVENLIDFEVMEFLTNQRKLERIGNISDFKNRMQRE